MTSDQVYTIRLERQDFEGPIELLLRLIEQRKLAINDISLASVTDEYIEHLQSLGEQDYSYVTHFIYVASTLILIKSKSLIASMELTEEEEASIDELKLRLEIYKLFQRRMDLVDVAYGRSPMYSRPFRIKKTVVFSPDTNNMKPELFPDLLRGVFGEVPQKEKLQEVRVRTAVHINEMMDRLESRITAALKVSFREFTKVDLPDATPKEKKVYTVVGFLAMLEMARNGLVNIIQAGTFDDIVIGKTLEE